MQSRIGEAYAAIEAARLLTYKVVDQRAHGQAPTADANISRVAQTQALRITGELAHMICGTDGLEAGTGGDMRRVLSFGVASGSTEMQLDQIATNHLGLPKKRK